MRLQFNNINIVEQADIKLDGLTVIAGENGSGKSTVGKLLFSTVKAVSNLNSVKQDYKQKTITKYVESIYKRVSSSRFRLNASILNDVFPMPYYRLIDKFMAIYNDEVLDQETKCAQYHEIIDKMISTINNIDEFTPRIKKLIQDDLNNIAICLEETDNLAADLATEIKYLIESEFMNRICSFNTSESHVRLQLDNKETAPHVVEYNLTDDEIKGTKVKIDLAESLDDATYIESPLYIHLLDSLLSASTFREISDKRRIGLKPMIPVHIKDIAEKINAARYIHEDDIQELMIDDKGAFVFKDRSLYYQKDGVLYSPINVASGLKAFGLIQLLLETNVINERKMLIWDEPENHLHPKWQVAFASVLVDLAKNGVPVVISTHSPYFVQGIRYFAAKQDIEKYVNYYLAEKLDVNSLATIKDVTTDLNQIFVKLATPLNEIMNVDEIRKTNNIMDAKDLYDLIQSTFPSVSEKSVCDLHQPCSDHRGCSIKPSNKYIDFDAVEKEFNKGHESRPSVDAVKNAGAYFCFIEIKGWKKYLEWNKPSEKGIQKQAEYNLKGKLETSEEICVAISGQSNIFSQIPEVFILVTDIDVFEQGVENFHFNMMALATTSSVWESKCNTELNSQLEQQITTIPKYYVTCKQLENKLNVISRV